MTAQQVEAEILADAQEAGFTIINGLPYCPPACDRMSAFMALNIIWSNRAIAPLLRNLENIKNECEELMK